jgi:AcrR family transcriptional regulator
MTTSQVDGNDGRRETLADQEEPEPDKLPRRARRSGTERRAEIGAVTLQLMARFGLQGTTVSRIAREVGMEPPSLYAHFSGRHEMLLAAIDSLFERVAESLRVSSDPNIHTRLRVISESHASYMTGEFEGFVIPVYEFITAPRNLGLSEIVGQKQLETVQAITDLVEEGKQQGTIREDMDPRLAAWELMVCYWAEDIAQLMGIEEYLADDFSRRILDLFLCDMAASPEIHSKKMAEQPSGA